VLLGRGQDHVDDDRAELRRADLCDEVGMAGRFRDGFAHLVAEIDHIGAVHGAAEAGRVEDVGHEGVVGAGR
jgi:hypothetical protein